MATELKPWETKTVENLSQEELVQWVQWYANRQGPVQFDAATVVHNVLLWERSQKSK